jgi:hypothetical protein
MVHLPDPPTPADSGSCHDRRQFFSTVGVVPADEAGLLSTCPASPAENSTIRRNKPEIRSQARDGYGK